MKLFRQIWFGIALLAPVTLWSQVDNTVPAAAVTGAMNNAGDDRMLTPPPVSTSAFPVAFTSETRSNYLRGGITFNSAYSDNVLAGTSTNPVSDISYSLWPNIELDQTRSRLHWTLSYAPGFTLYQHTDSRNEDDQNLAVDFEYRLSPHVTVTLKDSFLKSSNVFNQPDQGLPGAVSGATHGPNDSVIAPLADRLSNNGNAQITYQFSANGMVGASATFLNLHYPNPEEVPGLFDSSSQGGSAFYSLRVSKKHYIGVTYQYQRLLSYAGETNETQTNSGLFFYSFYPSPALSFSFFGGPEHYSAGPQFISASQPPVPASQAWFPGAGASVNWQAHHTALAASYSHVISGGGGLSGAVQLDSASASVRQQITRYLSGSVTGGYANNEVLTDSPTLNTGGHSVSGSASLQRQFGEHFSLQLGYMRLHQSYSNVAAISGNPDTNREWVSVSYQFSRPLGR